ncbi:hypothetical protein FRC00_002838 [Tulasnella sp. 408]|nr:hypothetical protein FRC00_002838 [Tulasnella sp. 408]
MPSLAAVRESNSSFSPEYRPTALFVGGTSGVGEATARALAKAVKGRAHIILCGRNRSRAEAIIAELPQTPESKYEFIQCDVSLIKNVAKAAQEVKAKINGKLNYLVTCQGLMTIKGYNPTSEGIDYKLSLHFYSRWKASVHQSWSLRLLSNHEGFQFADELIPCLERAAGEGEEARFMSILHPTRGGPLDTDDLGLKKEFTLRRAAQQSVTCNDLFVEEYAKLHPNVSFIHAFPGFTRTSAGRDLPWYTLPIKPLTYLLARSPDISGQYLCFALVNPSYKSGGFLLDENGEQESPKENLANEEGRKALLKHYTETVRIA